MPETTTTTPDLMGLVSREISPDAIRAAASKLGEDRDRTTSAVSAGIPSVLTALAEVADSDTGVAHLKGAIEEARRAPSYHAGCALVDGGAAAGEGRDTRLLEDDLRQRSGRLSEAVARSSGITSDSAHKLMGGVTSFALLAFAKNLGALSTGALRSLMSGQRSEWAKRLPTSTAPATAATGTRTVRTTETERIGRGPAIREVGARRRLSLLPLLLLAAVLIAIPLLRGARRASHPVAPATPQGATAPRPTMGGATVSVPLPNGQHISVVHGSPVYELATFMGSAGGTATRRFTLSPLNFATGSTMPTPPSVTTVNQVADVLRAYPSATVRIESHTDDVGTPQDNLALSSRRSETIKSMLVERGVDASRIETVGLGQNRPTASNATEEGRSQNRRTDLVVTRR